MGYCCSWSNNYSERVIEDSLSYLFVLGLCILKGGVDRLGQKLARLVLRYRHEYFTSRFHFTLAVIIIPTHLDVHSAFYQ
jgi:hypothetical protein